MWQWRLRPIYNDAVAPYPLVFRMFWNILGTVVDIPRLRAVVFPTPRLLTLGCSHHHRHPEMELRINEERLNELLAGMSVAEREDEEAMERVIRLATDVEWKASRPDPTLTSVPKSSLNFDTPRLNFVFSDSRVERSKLIILVETKKI